MLRPAPTVLSLGEGDMAEYTAARRQRQLTRAAEARAAGALLTPGGLSVLASPQAQQAKPSAADRIGLPK